MKNVLLVSVYSFKECFLLSNSWEQREINCTLPVSLLSHCSSTALIKSQTLLFLSFSKWKSFPVAFCCWLANEYWAFVLAGAVPGTLARFQAVLFIVCGAIGSLECVLEVQWLGGTLPFGVVNSVLFPCCSLEWTWLSSMYVWNYLELKLFSEKIYIKDTKYVWSLMS
jgi:hypothetical protein